MLGNEDNMREVSDDVEIGLRGWRDWNKRLDVKLFFPPGEMPNMVCHTHVYVFFRERTCQK